MAPKVHSAQVTNPATGRQRRSLLEAMPEAVVVLNANDKARARRRPRSRPVPTDVEMLGLRKDRTEFPIQVNRTSIGEEALAPTTIRDITERKRAEEDLRLGAEGVTAIVDLSLDAAFASMDSSGLITAWDPQAEATFGWSQEESLGHSLVERTVPERYRDSHLGGLSHVLTTVNGPAVHRQFEMLAMRKDGHEFPIEITISSVGAGRRYRFNAFLQDITARGYAEAELQLVHGELERRVRERTREISKSNALLRREISERQDVEQSLAERAEELARSNSELEQFAYVTSHDLKEPLRMVTSYLQLLERRYKDSLDDDATDFIEFAVDGALRMRGLIDGLLAYSRVGTHGEPFGPIDVNDSVRLAIANLETAISESGATVTVDKLPTVVADGTQLVQLFQNLIGNAIKFRDGKPPAVHVGVESKRDHWLFCVRDNGIGISSQYSERIFVIFQRLHARDEYPGTGIGLAICRKIVERHGGQIWVKSRRGRGATFYFTIPNRTKLHSGRDVNHG